MTRRWRHSLRGGSPPFPKVTDLAVDSVFDSNNCLVASTDDAFSCGTFGFMIAAHQYVAEHTDNFFDIEDADMNSL